MGYNLLYSPSPSLTAQPLTVKGRVWLNLINSFVTLLEKQQSQSELRKACIYPRITH